MSTPAQLIIDLTQTDLPRGTPVYVYIVGLVVDTYYRIDGKGMPQVMSTGDNTNAAGTFPGMDVLPQSAQSALAASYPLAWANYALQVPVGANLVLPLGNINTANIPNLGTGTSAFSGRIYISVGIPLLPFTVQDQGYTAPVFGNGSGVYGSLTLYDWIEFSYDSEGNFNGNTTQVNQFGFPLLLTGTPVGGAPYPTQGALNTSRGTILGSFRGQPAPFGGSDVLIPVPAAASMAYPSGIGALRALSPDTNSAGANPPSGLNTYFDTTIATAYAAWQKTPLVTTDPSTGSYTGVVFPLSGYPDIAPPSGYPAGSLAFYAGSYPTMAALVAAIQSGSQPAFYLTGNASNLITSADVWQCNNSLASGGTAQKNVGKIIAAAFNRGMVVDARGQVATALDDSTCGGNVSSFYSAGTTYNPWAKSFHAWSENKLAYGFPYDDVCEQNPSIPPNGSALVASFIRVTLGKFFS